MFSDQTASKFGGSIRAIRPGVSWESGLFAVGQCQKSKSNSTHSGMRAVRSKSNHSDR
jgi:hypothetical protein